ncbi:hypothetical protein TH66_19615 [Carbonactinospora thermoautotrophica]|uniref:Helicase n=1 Tax=Carbonactinospora thermoautotrophica TaxID=1469144 RepID=A0A132MIX8_9ACTN|nr:helicase-related protein [Carbonactinospora thermoautotrophica]KWW97715.1 hypothetical protein TH66_19615 [Carbonactinospora thermoautotrophica]KWX06154.1 hypothetical protein TR74_22830 [Carbonactinospora thermoautotrophica]
MTEQLDPIVGDGTERPGLRGLDLKPGYDSSDRVLETFYVPVLSRATSYDRSVGYFRSSALSVAARGLSRFINGGGRVRLLCGAEITPADRDALLGRTSLDGAFAERLAQRLVTDNEVDRRRLEVLAWLAKEGRLEVRIAIAVDEQGAPLVGGEHDPYFHEKIGVLRDDHGDGVAFQGSVNESATAWTRNFESFSVYCSWDATATHFSFWANKFEEHWAGRLRGFRVYPLPDAARERLISLAPDVAPGERDPEEPPAVGDDAAVAHYLRVAPRLVGAEALPEATVGVKLFPHQRQVVERLAGLYPRSWLVADEVGLGKTISAGMALRRLLLSGRVRRALILAPANVCRQWQDELFEKFGLWVPRLDGNKVYGAHPHDVRPVARGANPYAEHPLLIASSHLARRPEQQKLVLAAAPYDLLIVDEAHHARRSHVEEDRYRPGRLLELLDKVSAQGAATAVWLLTATPMQVTPVELRDLLRHTGLHGTLANEDAFLRYFRELGKDDDARTAWAWLDQVLQETPRLPRTGAEEAVLDRIRRRVGVIEAALIEKFGTGEMPGQEIVEQLSPAGRAELRTWLRTLSPVGQFVTRHSRETLKLYRAQGLLSENLADRDVLPVPVPFDEPEQRLYEELDELIDRLMEAHGSRRGAGFVLTVYRRRLTSSWAAIRKTLTRRLDREALVLDDDLLEEAEDALETGLGGTVNDIQAVPLTEDEIAEIRGYIDRISTVTDSKFNRLRQDLDAARGAGHSTIVFTQFTDTLEDLRDRLVGVYRSQLATFTGAGGQVFREAEGWVEISKRDLVEAIRSRRVTVLLATDAASEGLNLQACSYLINYDMPWNPMRVEQRIGRIDRLGQARDVVHVRSYFIPGTVEESVYRALASRIDDFRELLGDLQPILGATERAFQSIFKAPRSERRAAQDKIIKQLLDEVDTLRAEGIDFTPEDPMPLPEHPPAPVTLEDLREVLVDRFAAVLDEPDRPVTFDPARASRDPDGWTALATYGHPRLEARLDHMAGASLPDSSALVLATTDRGVVAAVRADRTPPEPIRSLADVAELGPPAARGEAESLANTIALEATAARRAYETQILSARNQRWLDTLRQRFLALVHETLAAGCAALRYEGQEDVDPVTVWHSLGQDATSAWAYARAFQERLRVPLARLFPAHLATLREPIPPDEWAAIRSRSAGELDALMSEYRLASAVR